MVDRWVRVDGAREGDLGGTGGGIDILVGINGRRALRCLFTLSVCVVSAMLRFEGYTTEGVLYRALIGNYGLCWYLLAENR